MTEGSANSRLLAAALALAICGGNPSAGAAQGTTAAFDGFNPEDPFGSTAGALVNLLRRQCGLGEDRFVVGVASEATDNQALTKDQSNNVMLRTHTAFSKVPNVGVVSFSDIGSLDDLDRVGLLNNANAGNVREKVGQADVVIRAVAVGAPRGLRMTLRATHVRKQGCDIQLGPIDVASRFVGEVFVQPDVIFQRLARSMWQQTRDRKFYVYRDSGRSALRDPQVSAFFSNLTRSAISQSKDENSEIRGKNLVPASAPTATPQGETWVVEASLLPFGNTFRLQVEAEIANEMHVVQEGLILADQLPSTRGASLARQPSIIRASAPQPPRPGPGASRPARAPGDAASINITDAPMRVQDQVDDQTGEQRYQFVLYRESFVEIDVTKIGPKQISFKPELFGGNGMPVDSFPPGRARINLRRYRLPPGQYELRVAPEERGRHEFVLATRAASVTSMLAFEPIGRLTRRFDDWFVGERMINNNRVCYAYTQAEEVSPTGWREQRPYIWLAINGDPRVQEIGHFIDDATRYGNNADVKVNFEDQSGSRRALGTVVVNGTLQPAITNARGEKILDRESVRGYTQGAAIFIDGVTAEGQPAQVRYSLYGYRSAINAAALACGRPDLAQDLVWRR
jgi:hypothetical protein